MVEKCAKPPAGWRCTRIVGHSGPCAALPVSDALVRYGLQWNGPQDFVCQVMADGTWTPWAEADAMLTAARTRVTELEHALRVLSIETRQMSTRIANSIITSESLEALLSRVSSLPMNEEDR